MGFKVKDSPEKDNFEVENSINEAENKPRLNILNKLSTLDIKILQLAYFYAIDCAEFGVDVTKKWNTACQNHENLEKAHYDGYREGYEKAKQDYCDKLRMKNVFGEKKEPKFKVGDIILTPDGWSGCDKIEGVVTKVLEDNYYKVMLTSNGSEYTVHEHEMELLKEENPIYQFEIGQIVGKFDRYPNHSTFKILDRFIINLTHPYYKLGLIDRFFGNDSQEIVLNYYQYVPESELYLKGDDLR